MNQAEATSVLTDLMNVFRGKLKPKAFVELTAFCLALHSCRPMAADELAEHSSDPDLLDNINIEALLNEIHGDGPNAHMVEYYLRHSQLNHIPKAFFVFMAKALRRHRWDADILAYALGGFYAKRISRAARQEQQMRGLLGGLFSSADDVSEGCTVLDSYSGLGLLANSINGAKVSAFVADPEPCFISHHLGMVYGDSVAYHTEDYLMTRCRPDSERGCEETFDYVITEPPYRRMLTDKERVHLEENFPFICQHSGQLPSNAALSLWVQASLAALKTNGTAYLIVPNGWLGRGGYDGRVRQYLVEQGHLLAVVSLQDKTQFAEHKSLIVMQAKSQASDRIAIMSIQQAGRLDFEQHRLSRLCGEYIAQHALEEQYNLTVCRNRDLLASEDDFPNLQPHLHLNISRNASAQPSAAEAFDALADARVRAEAAQLTLHQLIEKHLSS